MTTPVSILDREMYSEAEAARLLGVSQGTVHYWLEGGSYGAKSYKPVLRKESTSRRIVTWAEFVEAGLLKQYRRDLKVSLGEVRQFIDILRDELGVPYPLATQRPWRYGKKLIIAAQEKSGLPEEFWLYAPVGGQLMLMTPGEAFLQRVTFENDTAVRWRPHNDPASPVVIDPDLRSGRPSVAGISTAVIQEYADDGYSDEEIAEQFDLTRSDVGWALAYENSVRAA